MKSIEEIKGMSDSEVFRALLESIKEVTRLLAPIRVSPVLAPIRVSHYTDMSGVEDHNRRWRAYHARNSQRPAGYHCTPRATSSSGGTIPGLRRYGR